MELELEELFELMQKHERTHAKLDPITFEPVDNIITDRERNMWCFLVSTTPEILVNRMVDLNISNWYYLQGDSRNDFHVYLPDDQDAVLFKMAWTGSLEDRSTTECRYYHALKQCAERYLEMIKLHKWETLESMESLESLEPFLLEFQEKIEERFPLMKLNRWLGYIQGVLIERGLTTVEAERDWTRPLFRPLDFS